MNLRGFAVELQKDGSQSIGHISQEMHEYKARRIAFDQSFILGSLIDLREEKVTGFLSIKNELLLKWKLKANPRCQLIETNGQDHSTFLSFIGVTHDLWLNAILKIVPAEHLLSFINYTLPEDPNVRIFYYHYVSEEQSIPEDRPGPVRKSIPPEHPKVSVTHVISSIKNGIEVMVVIKLSPTQQYELDSLLDEVKEQLILKKFNISKEKIKLLDQITVLEVFSNLAEMIKLTSFNQICNFIHIKQPHIKFHKALEYNIRGIQWFYPGFPMEQSKCVFLSATFHKTIKQYINNCSAKNSSSPSLIDEKELQRIRDAVCKIRSGSINEEETMEKLLNKTEQLTNIRRGSEISCSRQVVASNSKETKTKESRSHTSSSRKEDPENQGTQTNPSNSSLVNNNNNRNVLSASPMPNGRTSSFRSDNNYRPTSSSRTQSRIDSNREKNESVVSEQKPKEQYRTDSEAMIFEEKQISDGRSAVETINKERSVSTTSEYKTIQGSRPGSAKPSTLRAGSTCGIMVENTQLSHPNPSIDNQYEDTVCSKDKNEKVQGSPTSQSSEPDNKLTCESENIDIQNTISEEPGITEPTTIEFYNILLLGESGVGKSTFINALANYLTYDTLDQAQSSAPLIVMPVSFMITVGDDFQEKTVQFGEEDPNENYDHPGQSVTQYCRSYVFPTGDGAKLRIIDTPGMGDTCGLEQDDKNMEHILSFITNLPYINAICILLKPNESRLNILLRSYFNRLFNFFGENIRSNIVFCFTNTRSTFYAPGNTGPLLKKMIKSLPNKDIPFQKSNTFCFDSESFRYLMALQNKIMFDAFQVEEYNRSWVMSAKESKRFLDFIYNMRCFQQDEWRSIEHLYFKMTQIARPLLEALRNIFRNNALHEKYSKYELIELNANPLLQPSAVCYKSNQIPEFCNQFYLFRDESYIISNRCKNCHRSIKEHDSIYYAIHYEIKSITDHTIIDELEDNNAFIQDIIFTFAELQQSIGYRKDDTDPILIMLQRLIGQEEICSNQRFPQKSLNSCLLDRLETLKKEYERKLSNQSSNQWIDIFNRMYRNLENISNVQSIKCQLDIINDWQNKYVKEHEKEVITVPNFNR